MILTASCIAGLGVLIWALLELAGWSSLKVSLVLSPVAALVGALLAISDSREAP